MVKNILQLDSDKARDFFLKEESYNTIKFPPYIKLDSLIKAISSELHDNPGIYIKNNKNKAIYPKRYENVNYKLFNNKDGKYSWRLLQLIHPVLYVDLVHRITEESHWNEILSAFKGFQKNKKIVCASLPVTPSTNNTTKEQIAAWSKKVEQKSIELGLEYNCIFHTDIVDCYGAIYTHSIPWAIHTKEVAKNNHKNTLIGNKIDTLLRGMNYGQTNGIPQGSILMDFIAEMVLGYIDECLSTCLRSDMDYHIIRYRDDYRIFVNNAKDGETIIRELSKILSELGMRLSGEKTIFSNDVVNSSIKPDKFHQIINNYQEQKDVKKQLLVIKNLADNYPNSGALGKALNKFDKHLKSISEIKDKKNLCIRRGAKKIIAEYFRLKKQSLGLVSILVSIALKNPKIYPIFASILSTIICNLDDNFKNKVINLVVKKFKNKPNSEYLFLWLQRIAIVANIEIECDTKLFRLVSEENDNTLDPYESLLWNSEDWLAVNFCDIMTENNIINKEEINKLSCVISSKEVNSFHY
ncbi:RNA-directed DNA polymerase [Bathymodiolus thermophilus thioautotrophic gill symbiont]|uniref:Reverse transcriptase domain-containing protein n=1 Tax=Bathymodiolus thermophilus thioautotrophic gill symbiont TaxID=2360 RepID=A0A8H9CGD1_9GAMM|nr:RNA-directed DNA polymerase [Bathymodiolus thermophilus thioautotrophic gill symbiont]CAB5494232.1 hypothetical protein THERMOS_59 [Bathymodiolus thermophilus thioautotrophic gill symbiont]